MELKKKKPLKNDLLLVVILLLIAAAGFMFLHFQQKKPAAIVEISINGEIVETLDLYKNTTTTIRGYNHGRNDLVVQDGQVWIEDATCPDKICIHQGKIEHNHDMIVCLPNLMIVQIRSDTQ